DQRAREEVARERWSAAAAASGSSLAALQRAYGDWGCVELAREECKLAGLLLRAGDAAAARARWAAAAQTLRLLA
ncbi:unnamed protein product, partial [Prorocentrum cordatum]